MDGRRLAPGSHLNAIPALCIGTVFNSFRLDLLGYWLWHLYYSPISLPLFLFSRIIIYIVFLSLYFPLVFSQTNLFDSFLQFPLFLCLALIFIDTTRRPVGETRDYVNAVRSLCLRNLCPVSLLSPSRIGG